MNRAVEACLYIFVPWLLTYGGIFLAKKVAEARRSRDEH